MPFGSVDIHDISVITVRGNTNIPAFKNLHQLFIISSIYHMFIEALNEYC